VVVARPGRSEDNTAAKGIVRGGQSLHMIGVSGIRVGEHPGCGEGLLSFSKDFRQSSDNVQGTFSGKPREGNCEFRVAVK